MTSRAAIRSMLAMFGLGVSSFLAVLAALQAGLFPGHSRLRGMALGYAVFVVAAGWAAAHAVSATPYLLLDGRPAARRVLTRVALAFFALVPLGVLPCLGPARNLMYAPYAGKLYLVAVLGLLLRALLPGETSRLWTLVQARPWVRWAARPLQALAVAVVIVSLAEAGAWLISGQPLPDLPSLGLGPLAVNAVWLLAAVTLLATLSGRASAAARLVYPIYLVLALAAGLKVRYFQAAVQSTDIQYLPELSGYFTSLFGAVSVPIVVLAAVSWLWYVWRGWRLGPAPRLPLTAILGVAAAALVLVAPTALAESGVGGTILSAVGVTRLDWNSVRSSRRNGLLVDVLLDLGRSRPREPAGYSAQEVRRRAAAYATEATARPQPDVDLIVYMVESLMDPDDLGVRFTRDPMPALKRLAASSSSGRAIVPEVFRGSADTEFELFTGMSMAFLPRGSSPYKQYVKRDLPSLTRVLLRHGYRCRVIHVDPPSMYNRPEVYRHLAIDDVRWLSEEPGTPRTVRGPSDEALVDAMLTAAPGEGPAFVLGFANGTHSPYTDDRLNAGIDVDVVGTMPEDLRRELTNYGRALRVADQAIERLVKGIEASRRRTLLVVFGDHLPPFAHAQSNLELWRPAFADEGPQKERRRSVPLVIWTNVAAPREELRLRLSFLGVHLLERMGIQPEGFWAVVAAASRTGVVPAGDRAATAARDDVLEDYRMIQYDLLFGARHADAAFAPDAIAARAGRGLR